MAVDIEADLGLAQRVINLRAAAQNPRAALAYVRAQLTEAEQAYKAGRSTTRVADATNGTAPTRKAAPVAVRTRRGARNGLTERVAAVFADGKVHSSSELQKALDEEPRPVKKALYRLSKGGRIRHHGKPGSGRYVRATGAAPKKGR